LAIGQDEQGALYGASGSFAAFLVDAYGWATFMDLYRSVPRHGDRASIDAGFESIVGASFDALVDQWSSATPMSGAERCALLVREPVGPLPLDQVEATTCRAPSPEGATSADGVWASASGVAGRVGAAADTRFRMQVRDHVGTTAQLQRDAVPFVEATLVARGGTPSVELVWDVASGDYRVDLWDGARIPSGPSDASTYLASEEGLPSDRCATTAIDVDSLDAIAFTELEPLSSAPDGIDAVLRLSGSTDTTVLTTLPLGMEGWWCSGICQAGPPCLAVADATVAFDQAALPLQAGVDHALVLVRAPSGERVSADLQMWPWPVTP